MKRTLLVLLLLMSLLWLTACHTDTDPWPTQEALLAATAAPEATAVPTAAPTPEPVVTASPIPTEEPGGSVEPGFNG